MLLVHQTGNSGSGAPGLRSGLPTRKRADTRDHPSVFKKEDFHIHCARDSREKNLILAYKLDSLVRVSRRVSENEATNATDASKDKSRPGKAHSEAKVKLHCGKTSHKARASPVERPAQKVLTLESKRPSAVGFSPVIPTGLGHAQSF